MKKIFKILLLIILVMLIGISNIYAAENTNVKLNANCTEVKVGDTFTVDVIATCENGIEGLDSTLNYDKTKLEFTNKSSIEDASLSGEDKATGKFKLSFIVNSADPVKEKKFTTLEFKVLDGAKEGYSLNISLSDIDFQDSKESKIEMGNKSVSLKVVGALPSGSDEGNKEQPKQEDEGNKEQPKQEDEGNKEQLKQDTGKEENNNNAPENKNEDNTQANKVINKAGLNDFVGIIFGVTVASVISYLKYRTYRGI